MLEQLDHLHQELIMQALEELEDQFQLLDLLSQKQEAVVELVYLVQDLEAQEAEQLV